MILVDTSVWIHHLRTGNQALSDLLNAGMVLAHPFVIGELALGNLSQRSLILSSLADLPQSRVASVAEVLHLIEHHRLFGRGIGYIDAHLVASVLLTTGAAIWTADARLRAIAERLGLQADPARR